jgi:hypothetical protein
MANTFVGSGIAFGTSSTSSTLTGLGTITLLQSAEMGAEADEYLVKDGDGNTKGVAKYDHRLKGTIEFVPTSGSNAGTLAITSYPSAGVTISLTDALISPFNATFIVDGVTFSRSNTAALMARISISRYLQNSVP